MLYPIVINRLCRLTTVSQNKCLITLGPSWLPQNHTRDQPPAFSREQVERTAMRPRDPLDDGEAQASASGSTARFAQAGERPLQPLGFSRGNSGTPVEHLDQCMVAGPARCDLDRLSRVPQGIVDEVDDRPADAEPSERPSARIRRAEQGYVSRQQRIVVNNVAQQGVEVDCFLLFILAAGEIQELADDLV